METISEKDLTQELEKHYNKEPLYELWYAPLRDFLLKRSNKSWNGQSVINITGGVNLEKMANKIEMAIICGRFYTNKAALLDFYESQTDADKKIMEKGTWTGLINYQELREIYGQPVVYVETVARGTYYRETYRLIKDKIFKRWHSYMVINDRWTGSYAKDAFAYLEEKSPKLIFPDLMRKVFSSALPKPEGYYLNSIQLPEEAIVFNAEETIFRELPLIVTYYLQNKIAYSQKGYPNPATARKMVKMLQLKPFPVEGENTIRTLMIAGMFESFAMTSISESPLNILKHLFNRNYLKKPPAPFLLPHLKGLNYFYYSDFKGEVTISIFQIFREMPLDAWVTFENIKQFASTHFIQLLPMGDWNLSKLTVDFGPAHTYGRAVSHNNLHDYIAVPYLAAHIFLLAAFGLMEISIDENAPINFSFYDGLQACRLTALGAYMLGITKDYSPPQRESETKLSFDENSPVIRIEGNIMLADTMMNDYAVKVSGNRYQFSPEKFLKSCKSTRDLENKIALFKQTINQRLPAFWENYLQELVANSKAIHAKKSMRIFKLPEDNKELHRIIAQDRELRNVIIKAEGFHILVEEKQSAFFINRMKALGYLIE